MPWADSPLARKARKGGAAFKEVLLRAPKSLAAHQLIGKVYLTQGKPQAAIYHWNQVIALNSKLPIHNVLLGGAHVLNDKSVRVVRAFEIALQMAPTHIVAIRSLAWILVTSAEAEVHDGPRPWLSPNVRVNSRVTKSRNYWTYSRRLLVKWAGSSE